MNSSDMRIGFFASSLMSLLVLGGCAFGTRTVVLSYPPEETVDGFIDSAYAEEIGEAVPRTIVLSVFDRRSEGHRIGNVRNAFGMDTADVVTRDDVTDWVARALEKELVSVGHSVIRSGEALPGENAIGLRADILTVYCDVYLTYDGEVSLMVTLEDKERGSISKQLAGEGSVGLNWAATAESYGESLALALQDAISKLLLEVARY
jgi:hypothetical protein